MSPRACTRPPPRPAASLRPTRPPGVRRFCDNPLVTGDPWIRYYAGRALVCDGQPIGTLCLIDRKPRPPLDDSQRKELIMFADMVVDLVYRRQLAKQCASSPRLPSIRLSPPCPAPPAAICGTRTGLRPSALPWARSAAAASSPSSSAAAAGRYEIVQSQLYKKTDELQAKNRELSDLVDTANAPIFAVDRHLVVTAWNQKVSVPAEDWWLHTVPGAALYTGPTVSRSRS